MCRLNKRSFLMGEIRAYVSFVFFFYGKCPVEREKLMIRSRSGIKAGVFPIEVERYNLHKNK